MRHYRLTCQMRTESAELPHTPEYLASVANDLVKSFTSSHVTEERAGGIRLAFKDVLLVRCALNCGADRGNPRVFSMSVHCATGTLVAQCRSQGTDRHCVLYCSVAVPAPTGQTVTIGNFAVAGDTDMTMVPIEDSAAGHTLQHNWAISTSL